MGARYRSVFFVLFALSGFSGLIYESIWTHYLKLFLGHAAYAQTLVLAIFMGGMAIGSALSSRYSARWGNLLAGYAVAEGAIGLCALFFHNVFTLTIGLSYATIIPRLGFPVAVTTYKWTVAALMILPQSILLGMTFPLMSAGIIRLFPDRPGRSVALLYFTNSLGAAIGVLVSGFTLIRLAGLPGTMRIAGVINIVLALTVWFLTREARGTPFDGVASGATAKGAGVGRYRLFLVASLVTGAASFIYEIGWIRMLSLVLGSSTHAFELMLSAFIFGLAFGGLWIQRRIDRIPAPIRFLAQVQLVMGLLALSTLVIYGHTFEVMQWILRVINRTETGYLLFNLSSSAIAMGVMLPATFCAGMTLPLITYSLLKKGHGERSIGAVYAANTVGAIIGVFFAIHVGLPRLGLKGLITFGASLDILLGIVLLWSAAFHYHRRQLAVMTALGIGGVAATISFVQLDLYKMGSGVYRSGTLLPRANYRLLYHKDGKTATVSLFLDGFGVMSIHTNGKPDAAIMTDQERETTIDEPTMVLLGAIPLALNPQARTVASIGLGSGLTTHTLLGSPALQEVDTVEIEKAMVEAAQNFRPRVERVYTDPRSRICIDDAKTFFSTHDRKYDIIISEPSNPWVSGVAGLFSEEFYRYIRRHINDNGLFVQWIQLYEINTELVASVLKAVAANFPDYAVYAPDSKDIVIVAKKNGRLPAPDAGVFNIPALAGALRRVHVNGVQDIAIRKIATGSVLNKLLASYPIRANSDYYPVLDQNAAKSRFLDNTAQELLVFPHTPLPLLEMLSGESVPWQATAITPSPHFPASRTAFTAMAMRDYFLTGYFGPRYGDIPEQSREQAVRLKQMFRGDATSGPDDRLACLFSTAVTMIPYLTPREMAAVWSNLESGGGDTSLSVQEKRWYALFKAVSSRDAEKTVATARVLLENAEAWPADAVKYLVASAMAGAVMEGDREEASRFWTRYRTMMFGDTEPYLLFRLLAAESAAK